MANIHIIHRTLTSAEIKQMNAGFDALYLEEGVEMESSDRISFVALDGDFFIGCASGLAYKNGEVYSGWFLLTDLFIEKAHRSQGLGSKLLKATEEQLKSIGVKHIYLWTSGDKALQFYHRHAYHKFAEMEYWHSDGGSRVGLRKNL